MKLQMVIVTFLLGVLLLFTACGEKEKSAVIEIVDGIECVHCSTSPKYPKKTVTFEEELAIGEEDEKGEIILFQPSSYLVDSDGNIYISDRSDQKIKVFNSEGKYLRFFGQEGSGPGEFQSIGRMYWLPDERMAVIDYRGRRTSFFTKDGEFINSFQWKTFLGSIYLTTDSTLTCEESLFGSENQLFIKRFNFNGEEILNYGEFTAPGFKMIRSGEMAFAISLPYDPKSVFTGDFKKHWIYHCLNSDYLIEVYDQNGKLFRKIDRPYEPVPFTEKDKEDYIMSFADRDDNPVFQKMAKEVELPSIKTITERMIVDEQSNLWLVTNEEKEEGGKTFTAYDIFDKDGYYYARVWSDINPGLFANGKMYSYHVDEETELRVLKRYKVVWGK